MADFLWKERHLKAGGVAVDLHVIQDHLGITHEGLTAGGAQVLLQHGPIWERNLFM